MHGRIARWFSLENHTRVAFSTTTVVVLAYSAAIAVAEVIGVLVGVIPALLCHAILLPVLLNHYALSDRAPYRRILPVLALAPLLRILSLSIPFGQVPQIYWYAMIGTPLLVAV